VDYIYHSNAQSPATGEEAFHGLVYQFGWAKKPLIDRLAVLKEDVGLVFIYGEHSWMDQGAAWQVKKEMEKKNKYNVKVLELKDSGHHVYIDNSEDFNQIVNDICREDKEHE